MRASADHLLAKVLERKELRGSGVEVYGRGDAELIRRRRWVDLLDRHNPALLDAHRGAWLEEDRKVNSMLERSDDPQVGISDDAFHEMRAAAASSLTGQVAAIGKSDQKSAAAIRTAITELERPKIDYGALAKSLNQGLDVVPPKHAQAREDMYGVFSAFLCREMADWIRKAKEFNQSSAQDAAELIQTGRKRFVEADPQALSTSVVRHLPDADQRARALTDLMLQFRAPEDTTPEKVRRLFAGGEGVESVSELKQNALHVTGEFGDPVAEREYGLTRAVTLANPRLSSNSVLEARHIVSKIRRLNSQLVFGPTSIPEGQTIGPYSAIHHNFSANTPAVIESFVRNSLFSGGSPEDFCTFVDAMNKARGKGASPQGILDSLASRPEYKAFQDFRARAELAQRPLGDQLEAFLASRSKVPLDADAKALDDPRLSEKDRENLKGGAVENVQGQYGAKLTLCAELYRVLCKSLPSAETLKENLFDAGKAQGQVAEVIRDLSDPRTSTTSLIGSLVEARRAIREEFDRAPEGNRRVALWRIDGQLDQVLSSTLGKVVDGAGNDADHHRLELTAMRAALVSARLSGLDQMRDLHDSMGGQRAEMTAAIDRLTQALQRAPVPDDVYRDAMGFAQEAVDQTVE
ncbi:MAG TPA: hypothetical protein VH208_12925, partial [Myxococcaceae bacterium]|nr:hypothetical protein [Myxococcaceae bacterium]